MTPGATGPTFGAIAWFAGDRDLAWPGPEVIYPEEARGQADSVIADPDSAAATRLRLTHERAALHFDLVQARHAYVQLADKSDDDLADRTVEYHARVIGKIDEKNTEINKVSTRESK